MRVVKAIAAGLGTIVGLLLFIGATVLISTQGWGWQFVIAACILAVGAIIGLLVYYVTGGDGSSPYRYDKDGNWR